MAAGLRRWRPASRRHAAEVVHLQQWLDEAQLAVASGDRALAAEILHCRRLVKGYSDTHARGLGRFDRLMRAARHLLGQHDGGPRLAELLAAALKDADGQALTALERSWGLPLAAPDAEAGAV